MMPKGVEHMLGGLISAGLSAVRIPMMPKGVEHAGFLRVKFFPEPRENSDDAERR